MARSLWSGALSFGLLNIPVAVITAKDEDSIHFDWLDKRDYGRVGYKKYNKKTGKEIDFSNIVKGYEYEPEQYVIISDADIKKANPRATDTIDIEDFVDLDEMDPLLFEKPYYLVPGKRGDKGYVLLRKVMESTKKVAVGRIVMHQKQRLVAIMPREDYLIMEVLRYAYEVVNPKNADLLGDKVKDVKISPRELEMAERLVEDMTAKWNPEKYKDTYRDDMMKMINQKIRKGGVESPEPEKVEKAVTTSGVLDLMPLLKKSLEVNEGRKAPKRKKTG